MLGFVIVLIIMGLVIGAVARLLVPGPDPMGVPATIGLGVVGTLVSGFIGRALFGADGRWGSWLLALVVTVGLVVVVRRMSTTRAGRR
jgi:uncharacterized membrane protein YeaQ/YmgE (transglycosylase-associated protein family)